ncbi:hypothetical protein [Hydrogenophaga sp. 2FB]|uniref:hypothetical protein n=1 Tax=Hydrogenophaga sp. 2FB TaxID=2502187 RepID=UPI0010F88EA0|nr:hypothetical protein [Hydrogenophaga sp. 2FB]
MDGVRELLQRAAESGELVTIVYNGGSKPGHPRPVLPLSIQGGVLSAREPKTRVAKSFKLQKIASVTIGETLTASNASAIPITTPAVPVLGTLMDYAALFGPDFRAAGWNIIEGENMLAVGTYLKNGAPKKTPSVSLEFVDRSIEEVFDWETGEIGTQKRELTGRERPWRVDSWMQPQAKSFSELPKAMEMFVQEVKSSNPQTAKTTRR